MATWKDKCCVSFVDKQNLGLIPNGSESTLCLYSTGQQVDPNCLGFNSAFGDWTWGGFVNDPSGYANSIGGYYVVDGSDGCAPFYSDMENAIQFYYEGTIPPPNDFVVNSPYGDYISSFIYYTACSFGCVQTPSIRLLNSPYGWIQIPSLLIFNVNPNNYGVPLDFAYPLDIENTFNGIISAYQPTGTFQLIDDGGGYYTLRFNDVYYDSASLSTGLILWYDVTGTPTSEVITLSPC